MSKISEENIKRAIDIIKKLINEIKEKKSQSQLREQLRLCKSYIQSFGPAVINNGLYPAVAFFEKEESNAEGCRYYVTRMVFYMIQSEIKFENNDIIYVENKEENYKPLLMEYILSKSEDDIIEVKEEIKKAIVALKTAIRLFVISKESDVSDTL